MAKLQLVKGTTSYRAYVFIGDSSVSTGAGKTGLAFNTASLKAYYVRPGASATAISLVTQTVTGAYSSGGFVEIDSTNMPGVYRLDVPDAALATGVNAVVVMLSGATNMAPCVLEVELTEVNNQDATAFGVSRLDAAVTTRLAPTVASRTLDVTATGAAGIDWANVENPTTAVNLSATNIDTDQVVASVTGSVTVGTNSDKTGYSLAAGAITAAVIATDAIDSDALAATAITEIQSGLSTVTTAQVLTQVQTALATDTYAEPGSVPAATASLKDKIGWLFMLARNKRTTTATADVVRNDADSATIGTSTISDDGATFSRGEYS